MNNGKLFLFLFLLLSVCVALMLVGCQSAERTETEGEPPSLEQAWGGFPVNVRVDGKTMKTVRPGDGVDLTCGFTNEVEGVVEIKYYVDDSSEPLGDSESHPALKNPTRAVWSEAGPLSVPIETDEAYDGDLVKFTIRILGTALSNDSADLTVDPDMAAAPAMRAKTTPRSDSVRVAQSIVTANSRVPVDVHFAGPQSVTLSYFVYSGPKNAWKKLLRNPPLKIWLDPRYPTIYLNIGEYDRDLLLKITATNARGESVHDLLAFDAGQ